MKKRLLIGLIAAMMLFNLAACQPAETTTTDPTTAPQTETAKPGDATAAPDTQEPVVPKAITLYPQNAALQSGPVSGWLGEYFLANGIIMDVIPYSDEKTQAMLASGDLADIVLFAKLNEGLAAMEAGMLTDLDEHMDKLPHITEDRLFDTALAFIREYRSNGTGKLYFLPNGVGNNASAIAADSDRNAIKFNYALYEQIGAPEFSTMEEVIPILKQMQEAQPQTADGLNVYGMHLFADFDTNYFFNMSSFFAPLGYQPDYLPYGVEYNAATGEGSSMLEDDSTYKRGVKFFNAMYKAGLMDPDSLTQERIAAHKKIEAGGAAAGWAAVPGWIAQGYLPVSFDEFYPAYATTNIYGTPMFTVSAKCENVDTALRFLDMLADFDALTVLSNGPQGERWDIVDGKLAVSDGYYAAKDSGETYKTASGEEYSLWNIAAYVRGQGEISPVYGEPYSLSLWNEIRDAEYNTEITNAWSARYGYKYLREQLEAENRLTAVIDNSYYPFLTVDDDEMTLSRAVLKDAIVPATWEMIYAADDAEIEKIWNDMKSKCEALGIQEVIEFKLQDIANAKAEAAKLQ